MCVYVLLIYIVVLLVVVVRSSRTDLFEPTGAAHTYAKVDFLMHVEICDLSPSGE